MHGCKSLASATAHWAVLFGNGSMCRLDFCSQLSGEQLWKKRCRWQLFQKDIPNRKLCNIQVSDRLMRRAAEAVPVPWQNAITTISCLNCEAAIKEEAWPGDRTTDVCGNSLKKQRGMRIRHKTPKGGDCSSIPGYTDAPAGRGCEDVELEGRQPIGHKSRWSSMDRLCLSLKQLNTAWTLPQIIMH